MTEEATTEEFACWVCEEKLSFNKLVTHLRNHTALEKRIAYNKQRKLELAEMDKKYGTPGDSDTHLPEDLGREEEVVVQGSAAQEVSSGPGGRGEDLPVLPERVEAVQVPPPLPVPQGEGSKAADIAKL